MLFRSTEDKAKEKEDVAQAKKSEEKNTDFEIDTSELDSIIDFSGNEIKNKPSKEIGRASCRERV